MIFFLLHFLSTNRIQDSSVFIILIRVLILYLGIFFVKYIITTYIALHNWLYCIVHTCNKLHWTYLSIQLLCQWNTNSALQHVLFPS